MNELAAVTFGDAFNFYRHGRGATLRRRRLLDYLRSRLRAEILLVGEAPGFRGARVSGIPFTSERQLTGRGPAEATATIVQRALADLDAGHRVMLWNAVPAHPHRPGLPSSNRPPTRAELTAGRPFVEALSVGRMVIPVGRVAGEALGAPWLRHPSHGGATAFRRGLAEVLGRAVA